jgi:hypothetical protein
MGSKG